MVMLTVGKNVFLFLKEYFMGNYPLANYIRSNPTVKFLLIIYFVVYVACFYVLEQGLVSAHTAKFYINKEMVANQTIVDLRSQNEQLKKTIEIHETVKLSICGDYPYFDTPRDLDNTQVCRLMHGKELIP